MAKKPAKPAPARRPAAKKPAPKPAPKARSTGKGAARSVSPPDSSNQSMSIRKISNGWLTTQSGIKGGKYVENTTFSKSQPTIKIPK